MTGDLIVDGVPATITRADLNRLVESVGFKVRNLAELRFSYDGIYAEVYVTDENGRFMIVDGELARHEVFVRVVDQ